MRTAQQMIDMEVLVCVSGLVSTLANAYQCVEVVEVRGQFRDLAVGNAKPLIDLQEQAFELASPVLNYEAAAREAGFVLKTFGTVERVCRDINRDGSYPTTSARPWEKACEDHDIEPHEREVFEHWAVTDWFAEKLEAAGEKVDRDFAGMCVWARTATGQAIYMDAVIKRIYAECAKPVEG